MEFLPKDSDSDSESSRTMMGCEWSLGCGPMHTTHLIDVRRLTRVQLGQVQDDSEDFEVKEEDFEAEESEDVDGGVFLASRSFLSSFKREFIVSSSMGSGA